MSRDSANGRMRARSQPKAERRPPPSQLPALRDALENAALDAMVDGLADAATVRRVHTAVRAVLLRNGHRHAKLHCELDDTAVHVRILLRIGDRVQTLVLHLDG